MARPRASLAAYARININIKSKEFRSCHFVGQKSSEDKTGVKSVKSIIFGKCEELLRET